MRKPEPNHLAKESIIRATSRQFYKQFKIISNYLLKVTPSQVR